MRLNGIYPPVGTLLTDPIKGTALVIDEVDERGVVVREAEGSDMANFALRSPREVHSVTEHMLVRRRMTPFGLTRVMGDA